MNTINDPIVAIELPPIHENGAYSVWINDAGTEYRVERYGCASFWTSCRDAAIKACDSYAKRPRKPRAVKMRKVSQPAGIVELRIAVAKQLGVVPSEYDAKYKYGPSVNNIVKADLSGSATVREYTQVRGMAFSDMKADDWFDLLYSLAWCKAYDKPLSAWAGLMIDESTPEDAPSLFDAPSPECATDAPITPKKPASAVVRSLMGGIAQRPRIVPAFALTA